MPLRLALLGCSQAPRWARRLQRLDTVTVTAVADDDATAAESAADQLGAVARADSWESLLGDSADVWDAVLVSADRRDAVEAASGALAAGKHTLLERSPLDAVAIESLTDAARAATARLMVGGGLRYAASLQAVHQSVASRQIGQPGLLRAHRWLPTADAEPGVSLQGGQLLEEIDVALWLFGQLPTHVLASGAATPETGGAFVQIHLGFPDQGMALLDYDVLTQGAGYFSLSLIGSQGAAYADDHHNTQLLFRGGAPAGLTTAGGGCGRLGQLQEFATAISQQRDPDSTAQQAGSAVNVHRAARASLDAGQAFQWTGQAYESCG